jgi:hypothetical protein
MDGREVARRHQGVGCEEAASSVENRVNLPPQRIAKGISLAAVEMTRAMI